MNTPTNNFSAAKGPTTEMLAGVYLQMEGDEDLPVVPCRKPEPVAAGAEMVVPTAEDLAGHYVLAEGVEDLTIYPSASNPLGNGRVPREGFENAT